jgi:iodotyrosine deiodinase
MEILIMNEPEFMPLNQYRQYAPNVMQERAIDFYQDLKRRRTVREFSEKPVPKDVIEFCLKAAGTAPSGANQQPWHFVAVSDPVIKHRIREAAEIEERAFYEHRAPDAWLNALSHLGTHAQKSFLDRAPCLIVIFSQKYGIGVEGNKIKHYYVKESVGISTGILINALHHAGLVSLTYTPIPMNFLNKILNRPSNEKAFMILVTGYPKTDVTVPNISKKSLKEIATFI